MAKLLDLIFEFFEQEPYDAVSATKLRGRGQNTDIVEDGQTTRELLNEVITNSPDAIQSASDLHAMMFLWPSKF